MTPPTDRLKIRTPNGRWVGIEPLLFGTARLFITNPQPGDVQVRVVEGDKIWMPSRSEAEFDMGCHDEQYVYPSIEAAWAAVQDWDGRGDPPDGWIRHQPSNRRRPDGDPTREFVRA